ncbi:thiolase C-terminal domain-containing protein [Jatrophihabitans sp. DSM 45814]
MSEGSWLRDKAAIAGFGHTKFGRRGEFAAGGTFALVVEAIKNACVDAGISPADIDGYATYSQDEADAGQLAFALGAPDFRFAAMGPMRAGGGGMGSAYLCAAMAVATGQANYVAVTRGITQPPTARFGGSGRTTVIPQFPAIATPAQAFALQARRHMAEFGTTTDHFAEVAINARLNAANNPLARFRTPITVDDHHNSRLIADPIHLLDCCLESDGGACVIITSAERARDLKQPPVYLSAVAMGAPRRWGGGTFGGYNMSAQDFTSAGQNTIARQLYANAGIGPKDVDVAEIYDHFTPMVLMGLEDFQLAPKGESGPFVAEGNIRSNGSMPVNTHGGNLAEVYLHGMTHVIEGTRQMRGTSTTQIAGAEVALVVCGASPAPSGAMLLRKG